MWEHGTSFLPEGNKVESVQATVLSPVSGLHSLGKGDKTLYCSSPVWVQSSGFHLGDMDIWLSQEFPQAPVWLTNSADPNNITLSTFSSPSMLP